MAHNRHMTETTIQKLEALSNSHPELSWTAYEMNAEEMYEIDSDAYFAEMLAEALSDLENQ